MIKTAIISALTGFAAALAACLVFFSFIYKPAAAPKIIVAQEQPVEIMTTPIAISTPVSSIPKLEIKEIDINSISIETVYRDFFEENSKCGKTYNEVYGSTDGVYSGDSPCNIKLSFDRSRNEAVKTIEMRRYDKTEKRWRAAETFVWKAKFGGEQFNELAEFIAANEVFKNWHDGVMVTASNCKISVTHPGGVRTLMSNVDKSAVNFLPLVERFRQLDRRLDWRQTQ